MGFGIKNGIMQDLRNEAGVMVVETDVVARNEIILETTEAAHDNPIQVQLYAVICKPFFGANGKFNLIERTAGVNRILATKDGFLFGAANHMVKCDMVPRQYVLDYVPFTTPADAKCTDGIINSDTSLQSPVDAQFNSSDVGKAVRGFGIPSTATIASVTDAQHATLNIATTQTVANGLPFIIVGRIPAQPGSGTFKIFTSKL